MPGLAVALWAGLIARPWWGEVVDPWVWFACGAGAVGLAGAMASRPSVGPTPLQEAGLIVRRREDELARAVSPVASGSAGPGWVAPMLALAGCFLVALGWGSVHDHRVGDALLARLAPERVTLEGSLRVDPKVDADRWSAVMDVRSVRWSDGVAAVRETVWLTGRDEPPVAVRGDRLLVVGRIDVPGTDGFSVALRRRGIVAQVEAEQARRLGPAALAPVRWAQSVRALVGRSIEASFPAREAGLLLGLTLGDDSKLDPALERDFRASGLSHILVVSGQNVAMVLAPVLALVAALRLSRWPRFAMGLGTVVFFVVLTGAEPSVMRAGVMAGLALVGVLLGRPRSSGSILAGAVAVLLIVDPALVWSVGFQLSVGATAGMIALATPIAERLRFLPRPVAIAAGATLAAQVGVSPLLLFHFHEVPTSTIVANVLAFPAVAPALLLGLASGLVSPLWPSLGHLLAWVTLWPLRYLETIADRAARAPLPWITGGGALTLVGGLVAAAALAWWMRSGRRLSRAALAALAALLPVVAWASALSAGPPSALTVRFFDVGQGDAALLTSPGGVAMLVDGGPDPAQVATELAARGVRRLDVVVASHPHADHIVGLPAVLSRFPVGLLLEPGCPTDSPDDQALQAAIYAEGVPVRHPRAGDVLVVGDVRLEILSPDRCWSGTESDANNDAIVLRASLGEASVLFATEPEEPAQQVMLDEGTDLSADVLKVPHHGAATSLASFFEAADAEVAVVSVGPNTYGHPVPEVLEEIRATGAELLRTDLAGDITITFAGPGLLVDSGG
jgi:competence protein ComEC